MFAFVPERRGDDGGDDGGDGDGNHADDGSGFIRAAAVWCFALATVFYACLVVAVFTVELFADKKVILLLAGLTIYAPAAAVWGLARLFRRSADF